jgi:ABC-2 type transport system ATP-binding protein
MALVERQPGVKEAALFGRAMHAVVHDREISTNAITQALNGAGFLLERLEPVTPSLEDVFVSLIEARDRRDSGTEVQT